MTSTVLDVTVLLLCVSASVVALGAVDGGVGNDEVAVDDAADRVATETVTVTYEAPEATTDTRTVHATRAELLAMLVSATERETGDNGATAAFTSRTRSAITEGLGPRTRLDVQAVETAETGGSPPNGATGEAGSVELFDGPTPNDSAESSEGSGAIDGSDISGVAGGSDTAGTSSAPWKLASDTETPSWPTTATGHSWGAELRPALVAGEKREKREKRENAAADDHGNTTERESRRIEFGLGATPPRNADTTTAVLTHPAPSGSESVEAVRIVVRRW